MRLPNTPRITGETFRGMEDMSQFTHALIFDDLLIVAQRETACFVLKTTEGLMLLDAIWPCRAAFDAIVSAVRETGWDPAAIKKLLLTHGHADHTGCGRWVVEAFHPTVYLSERDDRFWREEPIKPDRPETWKDFQVDVYLRDGDAVTLGDKTVRSYATPGHTPGGLSYLFPVTEGERTYQAALWGGSTPPRDLLGTVTYLRSLDRFWAAAEALGAQVALSNHTALDSGRERIAYSRARMRHMPNAYVLGRTGFRAYGQVFRELCYDRLESLCP